VAFIVCTTTVHGQPTSPQRTQNTPAVESAQKLEERREETYRLVRGWVADTLKDPDSARFRNQKSVCGEVNAKNSYGGYVGFRRFIAVGKGVMLEKAIDDLDRSRNKKLVDAYLDSYNELWESMCEKSEFIWDVESNKLQNLKQTDK
jgi:hypothetical protein